MPSKNAKILLEKYRTGNLTNEEKVMVELWLFNFRNEGADLSEETIETIGKDVFRELPLKQPQTRLLWRRIFVAACLFIAAAIGLLFYLNSTHKVTQPLAAVAEDILPGGNKAVLTLSNGKKISLTDVGKGELAKQSGIRISKTRDGQLVYQVSTSDLPVGSAEVEYNTVETPRGGQYQIDLPDGTKVWLNAASHLKFPLSFANLTERRIELTGEAYFEVEKDAGKPFVVSTEKQSVHVLGTHFNVNAYGDDPIVKTTLLEGSVRVQHEGVPGDYRILVPGQQSQISLAATPIQVVKVDPLIETAWKNGKFSFENEPIENIMRQISRWYDVDVVYQDNVAGKTVWGSINRYSNVSKVLSVVERTGKIHFKVKGRRVIVSK